MRKSKMITQFNLSLRYVDQPAGQLDPCSFAPHLRARERRRAGKLEETEKEKGAKGLEKQTKANAQREAVGFIREA